MNMSSSNPASHEILIDYKLISKISTYMQIKKNIYTVKFVHCHE